MSINGAITSKHQLAPISLVPADTEASTRLEMLLADLRSKPTSYSTDIANLPTTLLPAMPTCTVDNTTDTAKQWQVGHYYHHLVIISPLTACEAAVIAHVKLYNTVPAVLFLHSDNLLMLQKEYGKAKGLYNGKYYYYTNEGVKSVDIRTEREMIRWLKPALQGIGIDEIYTVTCV